MAKISNRSAYKFLNSPIARAIGVAEISPRGDIPMPEYSNSGGTPTDEKLFEPYEYLGPQALSTEEEKHAAAGLPHVIAPVGRPDLPVKEDFDWKSPIARALLGASRGFTSGGNAPGAAYSPWGAMAAGGLAGAEGAIKDNIAARKAKEYPTIHAAEIGAAETARRTAAEPFEAANRKEKFSNDLALQEKKQSAGTIGITDEQRAGLQWGVEEGLLAPAQITYRGPKTALLGDMLVQMRSGKMPRQSLISADAQYAGSKASAIATEGGRNQQSARAANTVQFLLPSLQKASDNFARMNVRFLNTPIRAFDIQTGGRDAMVFKQYLTDTMFKMATALQQGGVPTDQAANWIKTAFPDNITPSQVPAAIESINDIMETQKIGALTPVHLPSARGGAAWSSPSGGRIRVQDIRTGKTGTIDSEGEFDPRVYRKL